jgi:hypothetical protein
MVKCVLYPYRDWTKTVKSSHSTNGICITVSKLRILRHTPMMRVVLNAVSILINYLCYDIKIFNNNIYGLLRFIVLRL